MSRSKGAAAVYMLFHIGVFVKDLALGCVFSLILAIGVGNLMIPLVDLIDYIRPRSTLNITPSKKFQELRAKEISTIDGLRGVGEKEGT